MNKKLFYFLALLGAMVVFAPGCGDKDPCKDVECINGDCFEGVCDCLAGYLNDDEGICTINAVGFYNVSENCSAGPYTVEVSAGATNTVLNVKGFWEQTFVTNVAVSVDGRNLSIARQEPDGDDYFVEGTGSWTVNASGKVVLSITYKVTNEKNPGMIQTANCTATFTQQ